MPSVSRTTISFLRSFANHHPTALINWKAETTRRGTSERREGNGIFLLTFSGDRCSNGSIGTALGKRQIRPRLPGKGIKMAERYLSGETAWITGGASGIWRRTFVCACACEGWSRCAIGSLLASPQSGVLPNQIVYLPSDSELAEARAELEALGVRSYASGLDLRSDESVESFFAAAVAALGKIHILVNAAGTWGNELMVGHSDAHWHRMIDVNLNGPYRTIKRVLPGMIERGWGRIINIGSTAASEGERHNAAYCAAKHGLLGLTRCVALEAAPHGVTCNTVSPGHLITTSSSVSARRRIEREGLTGSVDDLLAQRAKGTIQGRLIEPHEIAATVAFLCRKEAKSFTMENIRQSGGLLW